MEAADTPGPAVRAKTLAPPSHFPSLTLSLSLSGQSQPQAFSHSSQVKRGWAKVSSPLCLPPSPVLSLSHHTSVSHPMPSTLKALTSLTSDFFTLSLPRSGGGRGEGQLSPLPPLVGSRAQHSSRSSIEFRPNPHHFIYIGLRANISPFFPNSVPFLHRSVRECGARATAAPCAAKPRAFFFRNGHAGHASHGRGSLHGASSSRLKHGGGEARRT